MRQHVAKRFVADFFRIPFWLCFARIDQAIGEVAGKREVGVGKEQLGSDDVVVLFARFQAVDERVVVARGRQRVLRCVGDEAF